MDRNDRLYVDRHPSNHPITIIIIMNMIIIKHAYMHTYSFSLLLLLLCSSIGSDPCSSIDEVNVVDFLDTCFAVSWIGDDDDDSDDDNYDDDGDDGDNDDDDA